MKKKSSKIRKNVEYIKEEENNEETSIKTEIEIIGTVEEITIKIIITEE